MTQELPVAVIGCFVLSGELDNFNSDVVVEIAVVFALTVDGGTSHVSESRHDVVSRLLAIDHDNTDGDDMMNMTYGRLAYSFNLFAMFQPKSFHHNFERSSA